MTEDTKAAPLALTDEQYHAERALFEGVFPNRAGWRAMDPAVSAWQAWQVRAALAAAASPPDQSLGLMSAVLEILDGRDKGEGVSPEPWESVRRRLISVVAAASPPRQPVRGEPLHASVVNRIWKECKAAGLDQVAFAWSIQREVERAAAPPAVEAGQVLTVPAGWRLVPERPTPEMAIAGARAPVELLAPSGARQVWANMLAASPQAPQALTQQVVKCPLGIIDHGEHCSCVGMDPRVLAMLAEQWQQKSATQAPQAPPAVEPQFRVAVEEMKESHRTTHWVAIYHPTRPADAKPWDEGRITPYMSEVRGRAEYEAAVWRAFFNGHPKPDILAFDTQQAPVEVPPPLPALDTMKIVVRDAFMSGLAWHEANGDMPPRAWSPAADGFVASWVLSENNPLNYPHECSHPACGCEGGCAADEANDRITDKIRFHQQHSSAQAFPSLPAEREGLVDGSLLALARAEIVALRDSHCADSQREAGGLCISDDSSTCDFVAAWNDCIAIIDRLAAISPTTPAASFQARVEPWLLACFGEKIANDAQERSHRFIEEALELVQACGCTASEVHQLVDYVYGRPAGEKLQEVGGVMVTLAALCRAHGMDMHQAGEAELSRIWTKVEKIRAKQAAKPKHSPLPETPAAHAMGAPGWVNRRAIEAALAGRPTSPFVYAKKVSDDDLEVTWGGDPERYQADRGATLTLYCNGAEILSHAGPVGQAMWKGMWTFAAAQVHPPVVQAAFSGAWDAAVEMREFEERPVQQQSEGGSNGGR